MKKKKKKTGIWSWKTKPFLRSAPFFSIEPSPRKIFITIFSGSIFAKLWCSSLISFRLPHWKENFFFGRIKNSNIYQKKKRFCIRARESLGENRIFPPRIYFFFLTPLKSRDPIEDDESCAIKKTCGVNARVFV